MLLLLAAFGLAFLMDVVWAFYVSCIAAKRPALAAFYSSVIVALGGLNVLVFVRSPWSVLAAMVGGFCGTYLGVGVGVRVWEKIKP